ncbi:MAG: hypothetical protein IBJ05_09360 [Blastomonas sp.]|nr:hypothetical protein [Blastomonas sp.]
MKGIFALAAALLVAVPVAGFASAAYAQPAPELVFSAGQRGDGEEWLSRHGYPNAVLREVTADAVAADTVEGRAAA